MNLDGREVPLFVPSHDRIVAKKDRVVANDDPTVTSEDPMVSNDDGTASTKAVYFISECRVDSSELDFARFWMTFGAT